MEVEVMGASSSLLGGRNSQSLSLFGVPWPEMNDGLFYADTVKPGDSGMSLIEFYSSKYRDSAPKEGLIRFKRNTFSKRWTWFGSGFNPKPDPKVPHELGLDLVRFGCESRSHPHPNPHPHRVDACAGPVLPHPEEDEEDITDEEVMKEENQRGRERELESTADNLLR
ncbi:RNA pseudouridine synthase 5 [Nymphaea thermarum]|nr:RNA pseudouridine synthase 5 [Nymphaea thermarum]